MADPYVVLGVSPGASKAEIKAAFRKKAMAHHPDRHSTAPEGVQKAHDTAFKSLNQAYQSLMDDSQRYRQRGRAGSGGFARSAYGAGSRAGEGSYYGEYYTRSRSAAYEDPFSFYYRSGTGSSYWGWRQFRRSRGLDFSGLFSSFAAVGRAGTGLTAALGLLAVGAALMLDPLTAAFWERRNEGKLFSSIEADYVRRKQQQRQIEQQNIQQQQRSGAEQQPPPAQTPGSAASLSAPAQQQHIPMPSIDAAHVPEQPAVHLSGPELSPTPPAPGHPTQQRQPDNLQPHAQQDAPLPESSARLSEHSKQQRAPGSHAQLAAASSARERKGKAHAASHSGLPPAAAGTVDAPPSSSCFQV